MSSSNWGRQLALITTALLFGVGPALGLLPPEQLQQKNLTASEIVIGLVQAVNPAPPDWRPLLPPIPAGRAHFFTLKPVHVVKSSLGPGQLQELKVLFTTPETAAPGLEIRRQGWEPVQVAPGDLVIVYARPVVHGGQTLLVPVLAGTSVKRLSPAAPSGASHSQS